MFDLNDLMGPTGTMTDADVQKMLMRIVAQLKVELSDLTAELLADFAEDPMGEPSDSLVARQELLSRIVQAAINF